MENVAFESTMPFNGYESDFAGWPGLERGETPLFCNVARLIVRGFLRCALSSPGHPSGCHGDMRLTVGER